MTTCENLEKLTTIISLMKYQRLTFADEGISVVFDPIGLIHGCLLVPATHVHQVNLGGVKHTTWGASKPKPYANEPTARLDLNINTNQVREIILYCRDNLLRVPMPTISFDHDGSHFCVI